MAIKVRELEAAALKKLIPVFPNEREQVLEMEVSYLLAKVLGITRHQLLLSRDRELSEVELAEFNSYLSRRLVFEPLAYLLGEQEFYSLNFKVTKDVLIPRPETEQLVELAIKEIKEKGYFNAIVDICCGSGAIAISIAKTINNSKIKYYALDISTAACEITKENAKRLVVPLDVIESDLLNSLGQVATPTLFVSNPPYIPDSQELMPDVQNYEPKLALRGGADGLILIKRILEQFSAKAEKNPHNILLMEIGIGQSFDVESAARELKLEVLETYQDFQGIPRVLKLGSRLNLTTKDTKNTK